MVGGISGSGGPELPPFPHVKVDPWNDAINALNTAWNNGNSSNWESVRDTCVAALRQDANSPGLSTEQATQLTNAANLVNAINSFWVFQSFLQTAGQQMGVSIPST